MDNIVMLNTRLSHIRIILVGTSHPGNIGATARAMRTMGLHRLYLVKPKSFPHADATARAAGADDVLANAVVTNSLLEAIADCGLVFGTSSRERYLSAAMLDAHEAAQLASKEALEHQIALVFGCEQSGLSNEELSHCHYQVYIPSEPDFHSLNLAAAVQVMSYELYRACLENETDSKSSQDELANSEDLARFYQHLEEALVDIGALDPKVPRKMMPRLKRLFQRARMEKEEVSLVRGIFTAMQWCKKNK